MSTVKKILFRGTNEYSLCFCEEVSGDENLKDIFSYGVKRSLEGLGTDAIVVFKDGSCAMLTELIGSSVKVGHDLVKVNP